LLSALLVTTVLVLAAEARGQSGASFCPPCSSTSDCEAGANCFEGHCVFYDGTSGDGTATAMLSAGAGGAGGGAAGTGGGGGIAGTGGGIATGAAGTGGCVSDSECQFWSARAKCLGGACIVAPCVTNADCFAPETCDSTITTVSATCVIHCAWLAGWAGTSGHSATGTGGAGGTSGTGTGGSTAGGSAGSSAAGGAGGRGPGNGAAGKGDSWHIGDGCAVGGVSSGRAGAVVVLLAFAAVLLRRARRATSRSARR
jgi:hypothetical protein